MECVECVCVWLWAGREIRGECVGGLGLGFTHPMGTGGVLDVCLCLVCGGVGGVGWVGNRLGPVSGRLCVL